MKTNKIIDSIKKNTELKNDFTIAVAINNLMNVPEETIINMIKMDPSLLYLLDNPSYDIVFEALKLDGSLIKFVENSDFTFKYTAIRNAILHDGMNLKYCTNINYDLALCAINSNPHAIQYVKDANPDLIAKAISIDGMVIKYFKCPTEAMIYDAIHQNPNAYIYIKDKSMHIHHMYLDMLMNNSSYEEMQKEASLDNLEDDQILYLLDKNPELIRNLNNPSDTLMNKIINQNPEILKYIENPSEDL